MGKPRPIARKQHIDSTVERATGTSAQVPANLRVEPEPKRRRVEEPNDTNELSVSDLEHDNDTPFQDTSVIDIGELDADELTERLREYVDADADDFAEPTFQELQDLQKLAQYQDEPLRQDETVPVVEYDDIQEDEAASSESLQSSTPVPTIMIPPSRRSSSAFLQDTSDSVPHTRSIHTRSNFIMAMALWVEETGLSRSRYAALREILHMLRPLHPEVSNLPESVSTLKKWVTEQMPLLPMRTTKVPLLPEKLPSMKNSLKASQPLPYENLYYFDPPYLFAAFFSSPSIRGKMHFGFAEFVDSPTQLWHSNAWASSVRTTSGAYAHIPASQQPIFPSDFVLHHCEKEDCVCRSFDIPHLGRVSAVGKDYQSSSTHEAGAVILRVQRVLRFPEWSKYTSSVLTPPMDSSELILFEDIFEDLLESSIISAELDIFLDYSFGSRVQQRFLKFTSRKDQRYVRRVFNSRKKILRPLNQYSPIRAELELAEFTRQHFVDNFDILKSKCSVLSLPLLTFIDGFGLYRNMYRTLMGVYVTMASFTFRERARRCNVLPLTLGPHGSNFSDVVAALQSLYYLDAGQILKVNDQNTFVCAFTIGYLGDMPQQNANVGVKSQIAEIGCRSCLIPAQVRGDLDYNTLEHGRFHHEMLRMREEMGSLKNKQARAQYGKKFGLDENIPPLTSISPSLDIVQTRPNNPAHSEYGGLTKNLHLLLMNAILTVQAQKEYGKRLRSFPFPPGWARLQSPVHHLNSYRLQEHARWSIIIPSLLRLWLKPTHVQPLYLRGIREVFKLTGTSDTTSLESIIKGFAAQARSNSLLMADYISPSDRLRFEVVLKSGRTYYQQLHEAAAVACTMNPRSRAATPVRTRSRSATPMATQPGPSMETGPYNAKAEEYRNAAKRPNMHVGLHYPSVLNEYGLTSHCNVLIFEDKHREWKLRVYTTNHSNVEQALLNHENIQQTARLLLLDSFATSEPTLTRTFKDLREECPTLFERFLPRSEQENDVDNDVDEDSSMLIMGDDLHLRPTVLGRIKPAYCREQLSLPVRGSALPTEFQKMLKMAYEIDCGMNYLTHFGSASIPWSKKLSFTDKMLQRRITFACGDYVQYRKDSIGRVDHIFVNEISKGQKRLFAVLTKCSADPEQRLDSILEVPLLQLSDDTIIVGLAAISGRKLYILPLGGNNLLFVDWQIQFL